MSPAWNLSSFLLVLLLAALTSAHTMVSLPFPPRLCLPCAASGASCDGQLPVCSACLARQQPCKKPNLDVKLPWERKPSMRMGPLQHFAAVISDFSAEHVQREHRDLIAGITRIYEILRDMQYIEDSEIIRPPHVNLPAEKLFAIGLEPETITLLRYLPYLDIEDEISPFANSYSYLSYPADAREVLWEGGNDLAPWVIRLSECRAIPGLHGRTIIYNLRDKSIIQWPNNEGAYVKTYLDLPSVPAKEIFDLWETNLLNLNEIPWRSRSGRSVLWNKFTSPFVHVDVIANGYSNTGADSPHVIGLRGMFKAHGWPTNFRAEEFKAVRQTWQAEHDRLDRARRMENCASAEERKRAFEIYDKFLEEFAAKALLRKSDL